MTEEVMRPTRAKNQNIMMENRKKMSITGVNDVLRFGDNSVVMKTEQGQLVVKGMGLRIVKLDLENTVVELEGTIDSVDYSGKSAKNGQNGKSDKIEKTGFFSKNA